MPTKQWVPTLGEVRQGLVNARAARRTVGAAVHPPLLHDRRIVGDHPFGVVQDLPQVGRQLLADLPEQPAEDGHVHRRRTVTQLDVDPVRDRRDARVPTGDGPVLVGGTDGVHRQGCAHLQDCAVVWIHAALLAWGDRRLTTESGAGIGRPWPASTGRGPLGRVQEADTSWPGFRRSRVKLPTTGTAVSHPSGGRGSVATSGSGSSTYVPSAIRR